MSRTTGQYLHQKAYNGRQARRGLKLLRVWVPEKDLDIMKRYAADLRKAFKSSRL